MNKKMITIEELADGRVRVTVDGPQFVANGVNLSTHTIGVHQLADFAPDGQDLKTYASAHCTAGNPDSTVETAARSSQLHGID